MSSSEMLTHKVGGGSGATAPAPEQQDANRHCCSHVLTEMLTYKEGGDSGATTTRPEQQDLNRRCAVEP